MCIRNPYQAIHKEYELTSNGTPLDPANAPLQVIVPFPLPVSSPFGIIIAPSPHCFSTPGANGLFRFAGVGMSSHLTWDGESCGLSIS